MTNKQYKVENQKYPNVIIEAQRQFNSHFVKVYYCKLDTRCHFVTFPVRLMLNSKSVSTSTVNCV